MIVTDIASMALRLQKCPALTVRIPLAHICRKSAQISLKSTWIYLMHPFGKSRQFVDRMLQISN